MARSRSSRKKKPQSSPQPSSKQKGEERKPVIPFGIWGSLGIGFVLLIGIIYWQINRNNSSVKVSESVAVKTPGVLPVSLPSPFLHDRPPQTDSSGTNNPKMLPSSIESDLKQLEIDPDNSTLHEKIGEKYIGLGNYQKALYHFNQSGNQEPHPRLAEVHMRITGQILAQDQPALALIHLIEALRLKPNSKEVQLIFADVFINLNQPLDAVEHFKRAIQLDPSDEALIEKLKGTTENIQTIEALAGLEEKRLQVCQEDPEVYFNYADLGDLFRLVDRKEKALKYYLKSLQLNPNQPSVLEVTRNLLIASEKYREALQFLMNINPHEGQVCNQLADMLILYHQLRKPMVMYEQLMNRPEREKQQKQESENRLNVAHQLCQRSLVLNPNQTTPHTQLAYLFSEQNNFGSARTHLEEALKLDPDSASIYSSLATLCYKTEEFTSALKYSQKSLDIDPQNQNALRCLDMTKSKLSSSG